LEPGLVGLEAASEFPCTASSNTQAPTTAVGCRAIRDCVPTLGVTRAYFVPTESKCALESLVGAVLWRKRFRPEYNCRGHIGPSEAEHQSLVQAGTLFREALGVLRTATAPMTVTEIAHAVLAANNLTDAATRKQRIRAALEPARPWRGSGGGVP